MAIGPVHLDGIEEGRAVRTDPEAEIVIAQEANQRPRRKPGLESEGCIVSSGRLVDGGLDPGACVVEQQCRGIDRHAIVAVGCRATKTQKLGGQVGLGHADLRHRIGESHGGRVHDRRAPGARGGRADVDDRGRSGCAAGAEVHGLGDAGGRRPGAYAVGGGRRRRADAGRCRRNGDSARGGQRAGEGLVAGERLGARQDCQFAGGVGQCKGPGRAGGDPRQRKQRLLRGIGVANEAENSI